MSASKHKVLILAGDGVNCSWEMAQAFQRVGFEVEQQTLSRLFNDRVDTDLLAQRYRVLALSGGASFGDAVAAGKLLAIEIQNRLGWDLAQYVNRGGLVLGVGNGFQALIRMGVFSKDLSIMVNSSGKMLNQWVRVVPYGTQCVWLKGAGAMELPVRHTEGRIVLTSERKWEVHQKLERQGQTCLRYDQDYNGSEDRLAGLCDSSGRIFGMMPHPEGFVRWTQHPEWTQQMGRASAPGAGLLIFENAFREVSQGKQ